MKPKNGFTVGGVDTQVLSMHEYVLQQLAASRGRWPEVADRSGVPLRTLEKIARSEIKDPGVSHVQKLFDYFRRAAA
jgi:hypothetical protein